MDPTSVCRLCLSENLEFYSIFAEIPSSNEKYFRFSEVVQLIADVEIDESDQLSKNVCAACKDSCSEVLKFRDMIFSSNEYQIQLLKPIKHDDEATVGAVSVIKMEENVHDQHSDFGVIEEEDYLVDSNELHGGNESDYIIEETDDFIPMNTIEESSAEDSSSESDDSSDSEEHQSKRKQSKQRESTKNLSPKARPFACKFENCSRKFTTEILLERHSIIHSNLITPIKTEDTNRCIVCNEVFQDKSMLEDHMREHKDAIKNQIISCVHCQKPYTKLNTLIRHLKTHEENKTHLCCVCK